MPADDLGNSEIPPFWPRKSPHFREVRTAVKQALETLETLEALGALGALSGQAFVARRESPQVIYAGLSGGADSLALVAALCAETRGTDTCVHALCVDHGLQAGSRDVAEQAAAQAREWGALATVISVDIEKHSPAGTEAEARRARYRAFAEVAGEDGEGESHPGPVMVAHTAEDQAENLLLSSLRGHASAMSFATDIEGAQVLRPLLNIRRAHTQGACAELGVSVWNDPHNDREDFRRVAIRKQVLPMLSEIIGGDAIAPLAAAARDVAADDEVLNSLIPQEYDKGDGNIEKSGELDCNDLSLLAQPVRKRIIARWLVAKDILVTRAGLDGIDALCSAWSGQGGVAVADTYTKIPHSRLEVVRVGGKLRLLRFNAP